ncbi:MULTISPECIES: polyprenyl synthetase family protein [Caproicibacterium]|uniref:Farnesyl diphosphate synthase n=1 Tax=Caproicibacterium argilliputei TaxID=3030016 RepID=A0AA97DAM3_9FIRM|nr:farnesyl diphosphate synthase [Caproicibacterium argilliputei]WOC33319.1 polyprenyl synthetase family protein [Caproicibacterium argilliputei]
MDKVQFEAQMKRYAQMTEAALVRFVPEQPELPEHILYEAMRYSLLAGGKRLRPVLVFAFCSLCGGNTETALPAACAIEMVHTYSLIHDDLPCMDNDDLRRGRPSSHKQFGEANALLAGDALLTKAFETVLACREAGAQESRTLQAAAILARAAGDHGMVAGQVLDLLNENRAITAEELIDLDAKKTGAMIRASAAMGCVLAGAAAEQKCAADAYAKALGLAFQIQDDLLDVAGDAALLGKPTGSDAQNDKRTYVALLGLEASRRAVADLTDQAKKALAPFGGKAAFLCMLADRMAARES